VDVEVKNPTDLIVIDREHLERTLLKYGIDQHAFWNVQRLTPAIYNNGSANSDWIVKRELSLFESESIRASAEYVFPATVEMMIAVHRTSEKTKHRGSAPTFFVKLAHEEVPVYEKADKTSNVRGHTPKGVHQINTDFSVNGLDGETYWSVSINDEDLSKWLHGYVNNSNILFD
jgi:hypothetical protein